jgi:hypothetical protein
LAIRAIHTGSEAINFDNLRGLDEQAPLLSMEAHASTGA